MFAPEVTLQPAILIFCKICRFLHNVFSDELEVSEAARYPDQSLSHVERVTSGDVLTVPALHHCTEDNCQDIDHQPVIQHGKLPPDHPPVSSALSAGGPLSHILPACVVIVVSTGDCLSSFFSRQRYSHIVIVSSCLPHHLSLVTSQTALPTNYR